MIHLDTAFLVDLLRETGRGRPGGALEWIENAEQGETLAISVHTCCELRAGAELSRHPVREHEALDEILSGLLIVFPDERFAGQYGRLRASLSRQTRAFPTMDLLIATAAVLDDAPLVTNNVKDFGRVPGLRLIRY